jgi:hypothetical protein
VLLALMTTALALSAGPARSQNDQGDGASRGVRIIDAPTPPPSTAPAAKPPGFEIPPSAVLTPAAPTPAVKVPTLTPAPTLTPPTVGEVRPASTPALVLPAPAPELRPVLPAVAPPAARPDPVASVGGSAPAVPTLAPSSAPALQPTAAPPGPPPGSSNVAGLPKQPEGGARLSAGDLDAISSAAKVPNPAGLAMQILPGSEFAVGSEVMFQVSSKKPGYLILVDIEATGKLVQIYPNPMSLTTPGLRENLNLVRPGKPYRIPDRANPYAGFNFIASPPSGTALVVAILSDRPVQMVDLPDVPASMLGTASAIDYLAKLASELRIPDPGGNGRLEQPHWSFDAKFYAIR